MKQNRIVENEWEAVMVLSGAVVEMDQNDLRKNFGGAVGLNSVSPSDVRSEEL